MRSTLTAASYLAALALGAAMAWFSKGEGPRAPTSAAAPVIPATAPSTRYPAHGRDSAVAAQLAQLAARLRELEVAQAASEATLQQWVREAAQGDSVSIHADAAVGAPADLQRMDVEATAASEMSEVSAEEQDDPFDALLSVHTAAAADDGSLDGAVHTAFDQAFAVLPEPLQGSARLLDSDCRGGYCRVRIEHDSADGQALLPLLVAAPQWSGAAYRFANVDDSFVTDVIFER